MRRFDTNCILGKWSEGGPTCDDAQALLGAMDRLQIERALVRHTLGWHYDPAYGNALLMEQISGEARLVPCWAALPPVTGEIGPVDAWLATMAAQDVRAVCLYPHAHGYSLTGWMCESLLRPLAERRYVVLLETSEVTWEQLHEICASYPGLRVILLNTFYRVLRPIYALLEQHPNLHVEVSTLCNFRGIEDLCARFGAERLLLGTGQPVADGAGVVTALNYAALKPGDVEAIASGNLERLLQEVQL
jgi:hypothetical protein